MGTSRYSLENGENRPSLGKLLYVTHSRFEHDWPSFVHSHPFAELCYIKEGVGKYIIEDQTFLVQKNDFIIINSNIAHTEVSQGDVPLEYIILGVEKLSFSSEEGSRHFIFNCKEDSKNFLFYMTSLLKEMKEKQTGYAMICQNLLEVLIVKITRHTHLSVESDTSPKASRECIKVKNYIDANFAQDITLDTLSQLTHMNKYYLAHTFTKLFGCSPINYLCDVRLQTSRELLSSTDLNVTAIAQSAGFSSLSYFSQCFQKRYGITPSAYRKQLNKR